MAALLLLRQGRAAALKALLDTHRTRGLASTVSLAAESGKSDRAQSPSSKKQSPPKKPAPAAAPPEPFDNSKYRNLQHHEYTPYTFLDVNTQLAGQRLPQPSSGRESPRH
ncbi:NADH dehydrogenase [ubiquinone] flavoprotein 3, mitochondrial [Suncus etruscus]|uniref:NADH dehydrogenase [ubiquinone] flavoprotein 3, mitochondrial n=1 Tax=Suncus etruscus TaxID=109475 RepID=UPI0021106552|nr:NADH dehydrogenase [ubiquinone] flavoprotein 3, mitochondrial [Suncus etruscus]